MQKLYQIVSIFLILLGAASMCGMAYLRVVDANTIETTSMPQAIESDTVHAEESLDLEVVEAAKPTVQAGRLQFHTGISSSDYMWIPLEKNIKADAIEIENHYMVKQLWIHIIGTTASFYERSIIDGNCNAVQAGIYESTEDGAWLKFSLDSIYEFNTVLENNILYVEFVPPVQMYDQIVVIDPAIYITGDMLGENLNMSASQIELSNDVCLKITQKLKDKLDQSKVRVYYTRLTAIEVPKEDCSDLANLVKADLYIRIEVAGNEDSSVYGVRTVYNDSYFIPGFGSVELADQLERSVVSLVSGKGLGLFPGVAQQTPIMDAKVPAAAIQVGHITNAQEAKLLGKEEYLDKIADGIYAVIAARYKDK